MPDKIYLETGGIYLIPDSHQNPCLSPYLPSMDIEFENTGIQVDIGASKSALKSAFKKNATNKTLNRPLLNKFIGMVA